MSLMTLTESHFDFELANQLRTFPGTFFHVCADEVNSINESSITESGFISISLKQPTPLSLFTNVFDQEILLIKQTFMEKESHHQKKE